MRFTTSAERAPEAVILRIADADPLGRKPAIEVLCAAEHYCEACRRIIVRGEVAWKWTKGENGGRDWRDVFVCSDCPQPSPPAVRVPFHRIVDADWRRPRVVPRVGRGRPALHFTPGEVDTIRRLRAEGFGEGTLAREFFELSGRKISARTLSKIGRGVETLSEAVSS